MQENVEKCESLAVATINKIHDQQTQTRTTEHGTLTKTTCCLRVHVEDLMKPLQLKELARQCDLAASCAALLGAAAATRFTAVLAFLLLQARISRLVTCHCLCCSLRRPTCRAGRHC